MAARQSARLDMHRLRVVWSTTLARMWLETYLKLTKLPSLSTPAKIHERSVDTDELVAAMPPLSISSPIHFGKFTVTASVFHLTPLSFAIVNLKPILPGHVLVSPRRVVPRFADLTADEVCDLFLTTQRVSRTVSRVFGASAMNIAVQDGADAGQSVPHVHAHVIPRTGGDMDERGGGDKIYEIMEGPDGDVGGELEKRRRGGARVTVDADEDRKPRSSEEMQKEAEWLAQEMEKDEKSSG